MEEQEKASLQGELSMLNRSLFFLLIIIAAILLSYAATVRQRDAVCLTLAGQDEAAQRVGDVYALRKRADAFIVGALGFFLCVAISLLPQAETEEAKRSAQANLWASTLVLAAAIIRFGSLEQDRRESLAQETGILADTEMED